MQPKDKTGRAEIALNLINKLYGIERDTNKVGDEQRHETHQQKSLPILAQCIRAMNSTSQSDS